jgi:hypothetical protein
MANNIESLIHPNIEKAANVLSIATFSSRGFDLTNSSYVDRLLSNCDVLLYKSLGCLIHNYYSWAKLIQTFLPVLLCDFDDMLKCFLVTRIGMRNSMEIGYFMLVRVETIQTNNRRVCSIQMCSDINVCMSYEDGDEHCDDFCVQLSITDCLTSHNTVTLS